MNFYLAWASFCNSLVNLTEAWVTLTEAWVGFCKECVNLTQMCMGKFLFGVDWFLKSVD